MFNKTITLITQPGRLAVNNSSLPCRIPTRIQYLLLTRNERIYFLLIRTGDAVVVVIIIIIFSTSYAAPHICTHIHFHLR